MLTTTKSITLTGQSKITVDNEAVTVISMTANIKETSGNSNITTTIVNQKLYDANKAECRADKAAFEAAVYAIEDEE